VVASLHLPAEQCVPLLAGIKGIGAKTAEKFKDEWDKSHQSAELMAEQALTELGVRAFLMQ
jgi:3-methyladenine DNA glycosylase AlkD